MKYTAGNSPLKCLMRQSTWYREAGRTTIRGVLWHSTGADNPSLKRYVQPDDDAPDRSELLALLGVNKSGNDWNHIERQAGVHAWVGKLASGEVAAVQVGEWNKKAWGCGAGKRGSCNNGWIQFEICEDGLDDPAYFEQIYQEAVELTAYLCRLYKLDPLGMVPYKGVQVPVILCHQDSYQLGLGSSHVDVLHWFPKFGKSMENVRNDVALAMKGEHDEMLTYEQWKEYMERYRKELGEEKAAPWAVPFIQRAIDAGIMAETGGSIDRPADFLTRQEAAVIAVNTMKAAKK